MALAMIAKRVKLNDSQSAIFHQNLTMVLYFIL